jgi:hypothetical protein
MPTPVLPVGRSCKQSLASAGLDPASVDGDVMDPSLCFVLERGSASNDGPFLNLLAP